MPGYSYLARGARGFWHAAPFFHALSFKCLLSLDPDTSIRPPGLVSTVALLLTVHSSLFTLEAVNSRAVNREVNPAA